MRVRVLIAGAVLAGTSVLSPVAAFAQEEEGTEPEITHEAEECIHILEEGGEVDECHEAPSPIIPEASEIVWGSISFVVLFFLLAKLAYPQIKKSMEARSERIRQSLDEAERAKADAETVLSDYQRQLADARSESARIIEEARQAADALRRDLIARAEAEAAEQRQRATADIQAATERALTDLRAQVAELAIGAAEKVVVSSLDRDTQVRLIEDYINQVGAARNAG